VDSSQTPAKTPASLPATATWLPLLAAYLLAIVFWLPAARFACWVVLWGCYALGSEPAPPAPYTFWAH
jgi:hypothetical protein